MPNLEDFFLLNFIQYKGLRVTQRSVTVEMAVMNVVRKMNGREVDR